MDGFTTLGDAARVTHSKPGNAPTGGTHGRESSTRNRQTVSWAAFEPVLNQLRISTGERTDGKILHAMGYSAGSFAEWRRVGVPTVALYAARGLLASIGGRFEPQIKIQRQMERDEIADLLGLVARLPLTEPKVAGWISRLAKEIAAA